MSTPTLLSRIPAMRVLAPLAVGIAIHRLWHCWWAPLLLLCLAIASYITLSVWGKSPERRFRLRPYYFVALCVAGMAIGWLSAVINCPSELTQDQRYNRELSGTINQLDYTDFSMQLAINVIDPQLPRCRVLLTTRGCDYTLQAGDIVAWQASLDEVKNLGNPHEMDYSSYLRDIKGIRYQQHIALGEMKKVGHRPSLSAQMAEMRRTLERSVFGSHLSPSAQHLVVALLLGDSGQIDKTIRQDYSSSGIAHILALSGLHVGIIALLVWWLLFPLDYLRLKKLRLVITLVAIGTFVVFTGSSPSVVRAAVMIGFTFASLLFSKRSAPHNALCMAAIIILVFNPSALYSVGFQLSFITVGAILLFPDVPQTLKSRHAFVNYLTATVFTSLIAMAATAALSAHYFHTISLVSAISNLLVLPVLPLFMVLAALFLLVTSAGMYVPCIDVCLDAVSGYIHEVAARVGALPLSHLHGVYVSTCGTVISLVMVAFLLLWLYQRSFRWLMCAGVALVMLLSHSLLVESRISHRGLVVLNSFTSTPILYYDQGIGYLWIPDDDNIDEPSLSRFYSGFMAYHGISEMKVLNGDTALHVNDGFIKPPFAYLLGHRLMVVGTGGLTMPSTVDGITVDEVVVTKRYRKSLSLLHEHCRFDRAILSGSMQTATAKSLLHECDSLGISSHNIATTGAIELPLLVPDGL